jgi:hypothetical protein
MAEIQPVNNNFPTLDAEALKSAGTLKKGVAQSPQRHVQTDRTKAAKTPETRSQQTAVRKPADPVRFYHPRQVRKKAAPLPELGKNIDIRV